MAKVLNDNHIAAYLRRIGYTGPTAPTPETLRDLHRAHMLTVPFENLDIHFKRRIVLDEGRFFEKIVRKQRGGFCYELNGLFAALLHDLGFRVTMLSGRVFSGEKVGPEFDHMALLVQLDKRWLADVGFGDSFIEPLDLDYQGEQMQQGIGYRLQRDGDVWIVEERRTGQEWTPAYQFTLQPRALEEFSAMCDWQQTSLESHFTQKRICSLARPDGRITLSDTRLIVTERGNRHEQVIEDDMEYVRVLKTHFGIDILMRERTQTGTT